MDFWGKAGKKAKEAAFIAAGTTLKAGSKIKQGAGNLYDKAAEDLQMKKEIDRINDNCAKIREKFEKDKSEFESDFQKEKEQFSQILDQINYRLPTYNAIITYMEQSQSNTMYMTARGVNSASFILNRDIDPKTGESLKAAGAVGIATGLGTVGLITAFGSASTGTALSALTGSAYIHATLAALGGGSLAAGGFGMVGGAIVLGSAFLAPATVVGGYLFNKQIRKAYEEAISRKAEALEFKIEQQLFFQKLHKGLQSFRKLNYELYAFSKFFDELLNMSIPAFAIGINADYKKLVKKSIEIIHAFVNIPIITKNKTINIRLDEEIQKAVKQVGECKSWLGMLLRALCMEEVEAMNKARYQEVEVETAEEIVDLVKKLRKENGWKDSKIKYQETTINTQANKICEQEREIIEGNESIRKLTERLKEIQAHLSESQGNNEQAEKIIEELRLQAIENNPKRYQQYEDELRKNYIHLNTKSLQFVASGEMLYDMFNKHEFEGIDYSSVIIEYGNCVEGLLKAALVKKNIPITMRTGSKYAPIGQIINDCVHAKKYRENFEEGFYELLDEFNRKCRVTAAHGRGVNKEMMEKARGYLFKGNEKYAKGLLTYFDDLHSL